MKYLLDTNICVHFLRGAFHLDAKLREVGLANCCISEITLAELEYGVANSAPDYQARQQEALLNFTEIFEGRILPIRDCFQLYARNRARLRRLGSPVSDFDLLIGCTGVANGLIVVTENVTEFSRIEDLQIENWVVRSS